jgi:hypothetical protein
MGSTVAARCAGKLTNTPHFSNPSGNVSSGSFGTITSTLNGYGNRQLQMALRLKF